MSLTIEDSSSLLNGETQLFTERRFQFALSRFDSRIDVIEVKVTRKIDARKLVQHKCSVSIGIRRAENVSLAESDPDLKKCLGRAAERSGRAVGRSIERWQANDRLQPASANANKI